MKKNITLFLIFFMCIFLSYVFLIDKKETSKEILESNRLLSIMLETGANTGIYEASESNDIPSDDIYEINLEKSGCENGGTVLYDEVNDKIVIKSNVSDKCYIYYNYAYVEYGTIDNPYQISSIEDLVDLSTNATNGEKYTGKYFSLTRDLNFLDDDSYNDSSRTDYGDYNNDGTVSSLKTELTTGRGFLPIAFRGINSSASFNGTLEGNNHTISNLYINNSISGTRIGLFGDTNYATIKNLTITGTVQSSETVNAGGLIGSSIGGTYENISNEANVSQPTGSNSNGGIIGMAFRIVNLTNCHNKGTISGSNNAGGLIGYVSSDTKATIKRSSNTGTIIQNIGNNAGGLIGRDNATTSTITIEDSYNTGTVSTNIDNASAIGGLVGRINGTATIKNCYNTNSISNNMTTITKYSHVGGLVGRTNTSTSLLKIENSYNIGLVNGGLNVGGILGHLNASSTAIIYNTYNTANITSTASHSSSDTLASGLIGLSGESANIYVLNSFNSGNVVVKNNAAGIANGHMVNKYIIINSFNAGNITDNTSGWSVNGIGFINTIGKLYLNNVYSSGTLTGSPKYGIVYEYGAQASPSTITNVYYNSLYTPAAYDRTNYTSMVVSSMASQTFVNTLNGNTSSISLSDVDELLEDYEIKSWKLGSNGYPTIDY